MNTSSDTPVSDELLEAIKETINLLKKENSHDMAVTKIIGFKGKKSVTRYTLIKALLAVGQERKSKAIIQTALDAFDKVKAKAPSDPDLYYNIATCYQELYDFCRRDEGANIFDCEDIIKQAFKYARKASANDPRALTNLGNLYDALGRPVEAIACYEHALHRDKNFGMALGNKAIAIKSLAPITIYSTMYLVYAHQLYQASFTYEQSIIDVGGLEALKIFQSRDKEIIRRFTESGKAELLNKDLRHEHYDESSLSDFVKFYTDFCIRHNLYLNLHIMDKTANASVGDAVTPRLVTHIGAPKEQEYVSDIMFRLNEIIEAYMTARMSLVQSQYTNSDFSAISNQTSLVNLLDYSVSNIYVGHLKSAYKEAFSALDKIAVLINHYLDLGLPEESCYYRNVWYEYDANGEMKDPLVIASKVKAQGYRLFGLYLLCQELCGSKYSHIRNALTHRYLRVYRAVKGPKGTLMFEDLTRTTIDALYKIKCAIMYVSLFIESKERSKRKDGLTIEYGDPESQDTKMALAKV
ncbi:MAG TPA: LA2681 family HEPN domain-containing protein [Ktedonobacteraceae bacterium]